MTTANNWKFSLANGKQPLHNVVPCIWKTPAWQIQKFNITDTLLEEKKKKKEKGSSDKVKGYSDVESNIAQEFKQCIQKGEE